MIPYMKKHLCNHKGITLLEVLAVITIIAIIVPILFGIITNGQNQYQTQSEKNRELSSISYALKVMTEDIRKKDPSDPSKFNAVSDYIRSDTHSLIVSRGTYILDSTDLDNKKIIINNETIISNISDFIVTKDTSHDNTIQITIIDEKNTKHTTSITIR